MKIFMNRLCFCVVMFTSSPQSFAQSNVALTINQLLWAQFSLSERTTLLEKFSGLELIPTDSVGVIQSVQIVNRSTAGTTSGAALGSALGEAIYIDKAFSGGGNNYSATTQLGVGLLGALLGSSLDSSAKSKFIFSYGVRTVAGDVKEVRVESGDEFTRPVGQCVKLPQVVPAPADHCAVDKIQFLQKLSALAKAPDGAVISNEISGTNVNCRVPGIGLMTLEKTLCLQMDGAIEK